MLIVPVENRPDWKHPPLATLLLIVINALVFFVYQGQDAQRLDQAYAWYAESGLLERERAPFLAYLDRSGNKLLEQTGGAADEPGTLEQAAWQRQAQFEHAVHDAAFARALHRELAGDPQWLAARSRFEVLANAVSSRAYAFEPRDPRPVTWITSMFLHADLSHLVGNMVFLFLFGFALEIAIGRAVFLLLYLCSGMGGSLLYWASAYGTDGGALGASGAISGLMGMYIALYGLRKITFFYHVVFLTGLVRAPALIVFPVWVGFELWGARYAADNVAYWAHAGGLLFGFVLLALWMRAGLAVNRAYVEKIDHDAPFRSALSRIGQLVAAMKLDAARQAAQARVEAHPHDARAWRSLYGVVKISPASREYHRVVQVLFNHAGGGPRNPGLQALTEEVAHEYIRIGGAAPALTEPVSLTLAPRLGRVEHIAPLAFVVERLLVLGCRHESMPRLLQAASNLSTRAGHATQARHFREQLQGRFPDSVEARQLAAYAPA